MVLMVLTGWLDRREREALATLWHGNLRMTGAILRDLSLADHARG
jgi:hypothetical protein